MSDMAAMLRRLVRWLVAAALFGMMVITCLDVVGRYIVSRPFPGAAELVQYLMVSAIFVALPLVTLRREHISISLIDLILGPRAKQIQSALVCVVSAVVVTVLCQRFWLHAQMLADNRDVIGFLNLPVAPAAFLASVLSGITALILLAMAVAELMGAGPLGGNDSEQGGAGHE